MHVGGILQLLRLLLATHLHPQSSLSFKLGSRKGGCEKGFSDHVRIVDGLEECYAAWLQQPLILVGSHCYTGWLAELATF